MVKVGEEIKLLKEKDGIPKGTVLAVHSLTEYSNAWCIGAKNASHNLLTWSHLEGTEYEICHVAASTALSDTFKKPDPTPTTEFAGSHNLPIDLDWDDYER